MLTDPTNPLAPALDVSTELEMFGTARIRLGCTTGSALVYATGGLAWAKVESSVKEVFSSGQPGATGKASSNHFGFAVGGGLEWAVLSSVTLKAEYLYLNVGDEDYAFEGETAAGAPYDTDHYRPELQFHVIRGGLNVKLKPQQCGGGGRVAGRQARPWGGGKLWERCYGRGSWTRPSTTATPPIRSARPASARWRG